MRLTQTLLATALLFAFAASHANAANWPTWRGPNFDGIATEGNPPITWSETENVRWKVALPGEGSSTPIVWENKIFITAAVSTAQEAEPGEKPRGNRPTKTPTVEYEFKILCLDLQNGELLWERTARRAIPHEGHHATGSFSAYSPVTDGEFVWASFGSRGLHCYDLDGNHQWSVDLIAMKTVATFGEGSSAALAGDAVVVVADHQGGSKIFAFDKRTGKELWQNDRDEDTSWATPIAIEVNGKLQVITPGANLTRAYDAVSGDLIWQIEGMHDSAIPSPVIGFGNAYIATGYQKPKLQAISLGGVGELSTSDSLSWTMEKNTPYVASPLLYGDNIYVTRGLGAHLSCLDAKTGEVHYLKQKIEGLKQVYASPVGVADRIYIASRKEKVAVVKHSNTFELLATNSLDDGFDASPIIIGDTLLLKGMKNLYCIAAD